MSDTLDWRRLFWNGTKGRAIVNGRGTVLTAAPVIGGQPVAEIDHAPGLKSSRVRRAAHAAERDMEAWEIAEAEVILRAVEAVLNGATP